MAEVRLVERPGPLARAQRRTILSRARPPRKFRTELFSGTPADGFVLTRQEAAGTGVPHGHKVIGSIGRATGRFAPLGSRCSMALEGAQSRFPVTSHIFIEATAEEK
jgi:hypothetical protein